MLASTFIFLLRDIVTHMTQMHQWYPLIEPHGGEKGSYAIVKEEKSANREEKWVMDFTIYQDKISGTNFLSSKKCC